MLEVGLVVGYLLINGSLVEVHLWRWGGAVGSETWASLDKIPQLRDGDPSGRIALKDTSQDSVQLRGKRKNGT